MLSWKEARSLVKPKARAALTTGKRRPLCAVTEEYVPKKALVVYNEQAERVVVPIRIMPWETFLQALRAGEVIG